MIRKMLVLAGFVLVVGALSPGAVKQAVATECDGAPVIPLVTIEHAAACAGGGYQYSFWDWEMGANHWDCVIIAPFYIERVHDYYCG